MSGFSIERATLVTCLLALIAIVTTTQADDAQVADEILQPGDRVVFIGNTFADQLRLYGHVETLLSIRKPDHHLTFRNLGWSGDELTLQPRPLNFGSLDEHLTQQRTDVIIACFGMNESFEGIDHVDAFEAAWTQFLRHLRRQQYNGETPPRVVILSPIRHEDIDRRLGSFDEHNRRLAEYVAAMRTAAKANHAAFIDLFTFTRKLADEGPSQMVTTNGIHPNAYGYWAISHAIADGLASANESSFSVDVEAETAKSVAGAEIKSIEVGEHTLEMMVSFDHLIGPAPPDGAIVHPSLQEKQPSLRIDHLKPGRYRLRIDGRPVLEASAEEWQKGVIITGLPAQQPSERVREIINRKNEWFFYRWRPANAEYVIGRRTKPFGAVSFPPEMVAFDRLIAGQDDAIQALLTVPGPSQWRIEPVSDDPE